MAVPTDTALKGRARALLEAMTERERWVYALPREAGDAHARPLLEALGLRCEDEAAGARVARLVNEGDTARFVLFSSPELEVLLVEASGGDAPEALAQLLDKTGFYAQSELLRAA